MITATAVPRCESLSRDAFDEEYLEKRPVILTDVAVRWPAFGRWTPEYFRDTFGDAPVFVQTGEEITGEGEDQIRVVHDRIPLGDYVDRLLAGQPNPGYLNVYPVFEQFPGLRDHVDFPAFGWRESERWNDFFLGPPSTRAPLHYDTMENLFCQLYGRKHISVISPEFTEHCYPVNNTWLDGYSSVDIDHPDLERFPRFGETEIFEVVLEPGEILYIPGGWWHSVRSLGVSISINCWWMTPEFEKANRDNLADPEMDGAYNYPIDESMIRRHT